MDKKITRREEEGHKVPLETPIRITSMLVVSTGLWFLFEAAVKRFTRCFLKGFFSEQTMVAQGFALVKAHSAWYF
ncbi:MAG: hypothetical protein V1685_02130 [Parcubacteria group bacterium]